MPSPPRPHVHAEHGGASFEAIGDDFTHLERRADVVNADVLDAWYDPSPKVVAALSAHLPWLLRTSPPTHGEGLVRTISQMRGIPEENLLVGNGSSSLIYMALPHIVKPGDRALVLDPTYGEYAHVLETVHGMRCQRTRLRKEQGFRLDVDEILKDVATCDVFVLVNPNSPTGTFLGTDGIARILEGLPRFGWLVIDETYVDFAPGAPTVERWTTEHENLVVIKSMSKYYALSGCRVGYLSASPAFIDKLKPGSPPWSVSLVGQVAAVEALRDEAYYRGMAEETRTLRDALVGDLEEIPGIRAYGSAANFVFIELLGEMRAEEACRRLRERGIFLRNCDSLGTGLEGRFVRTAVKDAASNRRIAEALRAVVPEPAKPDAQPAAPAASTLWSGQPADVPKGD